MRGVIATVILTVALALSWAAPGFAQTRVRTTGTVGEQDYWFASGLVGSSFGADADDASVDFGAGLGYLNDIFGVEFLANFSPNFEFGGLGDSKVNSYMVNGLATWRPRDTAWRPYASGGLGAITFENDVFNVDPLDIPGLEQAEDTSLGFNLGGGVMRFEGRWGVRGDVRYFRAFGDEDIGHGDFPFLADLDFWRANVGVIVRW